jgi:hypothetical protein
MRISIGACTILYRRLRVIQVRRLLELFSLMARERLASTPRSRLLSLVQDFHLHSHLLSIHRSLRCRQRVVRPLT